MSRVYSYKNLTLYVSDARVIVGYNGGFINCYYFTPRMKGRTKESVVRYLKRINAI